jgi:hypothetical protein
MRRPLLVTLALSLLATSPALAGPPWISIEIPANPYNSSTRGAFCLVRVYHHGDVAYYPVSGSAEGLVNGARRSSPVSFTETGMPGVYAVKFQPSRDGAWLLLLRVGEDEQHGSATVVVRLNRDGEIASARVPTHRKDGWNIPDQVSPADVDRMLREQVAQAGAEDRGSQPWALAGLALVPMALITRRRR